MNFVRSFFEQILSWIVDKNQPFTEQTAMKDATVEHSIVQINKTLYIVIY